ncbi:MAG: PH domain-containing protein [Bacteroidetes bacterium]|nr:PH domain-containing protein [Bacteroidota bacterium]MBS1541789.1 PH domain-containing protein [Bacteroidota bacterium]
MDETIKNEDENVIKAHQHLESVLVPGEHLEGWAVQRRIFALTHRRILIAATSGRFIVIERNLLGGFKMNDFRWQDLERVNLYTGIFGADISFKASDNSDLAIGKSYNNFLKYIGLRKDQTQNIYRIAQAQDQAWREKRRIREMEELRAKSGAIHLGNLSGGQPLPSSGSMDDSTARLMKAKEMLDNKLITDSEYESIKARIISGL